MRSRHQILYLTSKAIERCARDLQQAVEDFPRADTDADKEMSKQCREAVDRLLTAMIYERAGLPDR